MRIAFLLDALNEAGGTEVSSSYLVKALEKKHQVRTFLLQTKSFKKSIGSDIRRYPLSFKNGWMPYLDAKQTIGYFKDLAEFKPELIVVTMTSIPFQMGAGFLVKLCSQLMLRRVPVITIFRSLPCNPNMQYTSLRAIASKAACALAPLAKFSDIVVANSSWMKEAVGDVCKIRKEKIKVIYPPIDTSLFRPIPKEEARKRVEALSGVKLGKDEKILLFAGRISPEKGVIEFLDTFKELEISDPGIRLIVSGSAQAKKYREKVSSKLESISFSNPPLFVGPQKLEDMPYFYNCADLMVLPSIWYEPFGRVLAEAMACGALVAGRKVGGIPEVIGSSGWLLPEKPDAKLEAIRIRKILAIPPKEKEKIGRSARARVESLFSKEEACRQFMAIIEKAAESARRPIVKK